MVVHTITEKTLTFESCNRHADKVSFSIKNSLKNANKFDVMASFILNLVYETPDVGGVLIY